MAISDHNNSGVPQLYLRTIDQGFKCIDIYEELGQISSEANQSKFLETSVVYTYCANKLQVKYSMYTLYHFVLFL